MQPTSGTPHQENEGTRRQGTENREPALAPFCNKGTALQAAEKLVVLKGHEFTRAVSGTKSTRPLGPEGCFSHIRPQILPFSAACLAGPQQARPVPRNRIRGEAALKSRDCRSCSPVALNSCIRARLQPGRKPPAQFRKTKHAAKPRSNLVTAAPALPSP
jgi:hypothetical protein